MEDYNKCICCGERKNILIMVKRTDEKNILLHQRGMCQNCLLNKDIEKVTKDFQIKSCKDQIESAKENLNFWEKELKSLKGGGE